MCRVVGETSITESRSVNRFVSSLSRCPVPGKGFLSIDIDLFFPDIGTSGVVTSQYLPSPHRLPLYSPPPPPLEEPNPKMVLSFRPPLNSLSFVPSGRNVNLKYDDRHTDTSVI